MNIDKQEKWGALDKLDAVSNDITTLVDSLKKRKKLGKDRVLIDMVISRLLDIQFRHLI